MGYTAAENLVGPDVPDDVYEIFHPSRSSRFWGLKVLAIVGASLGVAVTLPFEVGAAFTALRGTWQAVDIGAAGIEVAVLVALVWRARSRGVRIDRRWGHQIIKTTAQSTDNPDTAARLAALDRLIVRLRSGCAALSAAGLEPPGITGRTADDLHYALAAPVVNSFALRDLLISPDAHRPELAGEVAAARAELDAMNAAFDGGYAAVTQLCDQLDGIRRQIDTAAARQRLRVALAAADLPGVPVTETPDIETMVASAGAMVEFLRSSLV
jgi:hypothetical protein